ncbi:hypothetical protein OsJ_20279 [Oryza sativa Japonica Group]|uniref:Uncharacterized protein n=1 Tax=Oryza sativa subsp. japonica TaxID=39947 RepID=B9FRR1_ORYSJ|nr:hypothetical protein OsJ_20279 [Oryza sativa Japonica Group]
MAAAANDTTPAPGPGCSSSCWWKRSRRVLYTEARKDAVDFLIGLLRVTRLRCGGFVFGTQICHNLVDAAGIT